MMSDLLNMDWVQNTYIITLYIDMRLTSKELTMWLLTLHRVSDLILSLILFYYHAVVMQLFLF